MIFVVISTETSIYGEGTCVSKNRYRLQNGLKVYFYNKSSINKEFEKYGIIKCLEIDEPIKYMVGEAPLKFFLIVCKKV